MSRTVSLGIEFDIKNGGKDMEEAKKKMNGQTQRISLLDSPV